MSFPVVSHPKPFTGKLHKVEDQWTDYNGHLNMAYYAVMFDRALEEMFEHYGLGPSYVKETNLSFFTLETHTTYANELHAGEEVRVESEIIATDQKRIHCIQQMFRGGSTYLACVMEVMMSHADLSQRRTAAFPPASQAKVDKMFAAHRCQNPPPQVGHVIGLPPPKK